MQPLSIKIFDSKERNWHFGFYKRAACALDLNYLTKAGFFKTTNISSEWPRRRYFSSFKCGWTKWKKCKCSWRSGLFIVDPCEANVHEFVSEKSEWPRPSDRFKDDDEFQRRVNVFIIFGHGRAIKDGDEFQRRVNVFIIFGHGRANSSNRMLQFNFGVSFTYKSEQTATLLISGDPACSLSTLLRPTSLITSLQRGLDWLGRHWTHLA